MRLLLLVGAGFLVRSVMRSRAADPRPVVSVGTDEDLIVFAELVVLALSAGLTLAGAMEAAAAHAGAGVGGEVRDVLRRARVVGLTAALEGARGRAGGLCRVAARAASSGAPLLGAIAAYVDEVQHADHSRRLAAARRLPVRLLIPLALLMLPGFIVLTAGPALLDAADRLRL